MICTCRDPMELGVVHRADAPCYYPNPPKEWQGLTDEEIENCFEMSMFGTCRAIEAKLKEKNT